MNSFTRQGRCCNEEEERRSDGQWLGDGREVQPVINLSMRQQRQRIALRRRQLCNFLNFLQGVLRRLPSSLTFGNLYTVRWVWSLQRSASPRVSEDRRQQRVDVEERLVRQFFLFVNSMQNALHVGGRGRRQTQPTDALLNLLGVEIEVAFVPGRRLFRWLDAWEVHRLSVLLQGHGSIDLPTCVDWLEIRLGR